MEFELQRINQPYSIVRQFRDIEDAVIIENITNQSNITSMVQSQEKRSPFIESNTSMASLSDLRQDFIPVFAKDNETTISHHEFIEAVYTAVSTVFPRETISGVDCRVSHKVCGRIPSAIGKPVKDLEDWEKTQYYERMAFSIDIKSVRDNINGNELILSVVGVRAYNHTNLYGRKNLETFKLGIGFINQVCTNMCVSTDGLALELRVSNLRDFQIKALELFQKYDAVSHINTMRQLPQMSLSESQFATFIGRTRLYQFLPKNEQKQLPLLQFGDSQLNMVVKDYYHDKRFCKNDEGSLNLWNLYNLFTNANRSSSYIDTFLDRGNNATEFINGVSAALNGDTRYRWFIE